MAIIASSIGLIYRHHNQSTFSGLNILCGAVLNLITKERERGESERIIMLIIFHRLCHLPSPILGVMIPSHLLVLQHLRNLDKAAQMHTLAVGDNDFLL